MIITLPLSRARAAYLIVQAKVHAEVVLPVRIEWLIGLDLKLEARGIRLLRCQLKTLELRLLLSPSGSHVLGHASLVILS